MPAALHARLAADTPESGVGRDALVLNHHGEGRHKASVRRAVRDDRPGRRRSRDFSRQRPYRLGPGAADRPGVVSGEVGGAAALMDRRAALAEITSGIGPSVANQSRR